MTVDKLYTETKLDASNMYEAFAADEQAKTALMFFSFIAYEFAHKPVIKESKIITTVSSKLLPNGKTIKRQSMPNKANFGIVDKNAKTDVSVPLYTSITQLAKGKIASFEIRPKIVNMLAKEYINVDSLDTDIS